jgi:hypothetical protein
LVEPVNSPVVYKTTKSVHRWSKRASATTTTTTTTKRNEKKFSVEFDTCRKRATNLSLFFSASFLGRGRLGLGFGSFSYSGQISKTFLFQKWEKKYDKREEEKGKRRRGPG